MARYTEAKYRRHLALLMSVYVLVLLLAWPLVRRVGSEPLRVVLALLPALPVLAVVLLMARRVLDSDELEQRVHMQALGVATGVVASASLVGGFLAAAKVLPIGGDALIWVAPLLCFTYGVTRWRLGRRYGGAGCE